MTCPVAKEMLGAYLDGELDANAEFEIKRHLSDCQSCREAFERLRVRQSFMRQGDFSYQAPAGLESRIRKSIGSSRRGVVEWRRWAALAAAVLLVSGLSIRLWQQRRGAENEIAGEVVSSHVRALLSGHAADVISTDRHTVKPWFNGRIDFSPPVNDFVQQGFPLTGGRIDYVDHRPVATLVYQRRKHVIDLFLWPSTQAVARVQKTSNGYNVLVWSSGGMFYAAVSDLNASELEEFKNLVAK